MDLPARFIQTAMAGSGRPQQAASRDSTPQAPMTLPDGEVHVWYAWTSACDTPALRAYYASLLNREETERLARFALDRLKLEYLVTRALCRTVLSRYAPVAPAAWRFRAGARGKPEIDGASPLRFNLSNAATLVACAVTRGADVGIDVERIDRETDTAALAQHYFARAELDALAAVPAEHRRRRFFELWTLKEAYLKATGKGLAGTLDSIAFALSEHAIEIAFAPGIDDHAGDWQFAQHAPSASHLMALAIKRATRAPFTTRIFETVPDG
jgi:4'-phosphopantetheinyl transferase